MLILRHQTNRCTIDRRAWDELQVSKRYTLFFKVDIKDLTTCQCIREDDGLLLELYRFLLRKVRL